MRLLPWCRASAFLAAIFAGDAALTTIAGKRTAILPEFTVEGNRNKILHVLAYMRDFSSLAGYTDTVYLFREKLVDYMLVPNKNVSFEGWSVPRTILSRSYYRFTNAQGLDSVSDECAWYFSWSDWMSLPPLKGLPESLQDKSLAADTLFGKYSPCIKWLKTDDRVRVDVNVLACGEGKGWCPSFEPFFRKGVDFDSFKLTFNYDNVLGFDLSPADITAYSYHIESNGRGHEFQRIPHHHGPVYVTTSGEVYVIDRDFLTRKEARAWENFKFDEDDVGIFEPADAPALSPETMALIKRVEQVDKEDVRISLPPDERMISIYHGKRKQNIGDRALALFKQLAGITLVKSRKKARNTWETFRKEQIERNKKRDAAGD